MKNIDSGHVPKHSGQRNRFFNSLLTPVRANRNQTESTQAQPQTRSFSHIEPSDARPRHPTEALDEQKMSFPASPGQLIEKINAVTHDHLQERGFRETNIQLFLNKLSPALEKSFRENWAKANYVERHPDAVIDMAEDILAMIKDKVATDLNSAPYDAAYNLNSLDNRISRLVLWNEVFQSLFHIFKHHPIRNQDDAFNAHLNATTETFKTSAIDLMRQYPDLNWDEAYENRLNNLCEVRSRRRLMPQFNLHPIQPEPYASHYSYIEPKPRKYQPPCLDNDGHYKPLSGPLANVCYLRVSRKVLQNHPQLMDYLRDKSKKEEASDLLKVLVLYLDHDENALNFKLIRLLNELKKVDVFGKKPEQTQFNRPRDYTNALLELSPYEQQCPYEFSRLIIQTVADEFKEKTPLTHKKETVFYVFSNQQLQQHQQDSNLQNLTEEELKTLIHNSAVLTPIATSPALLDQHNIQPKMLEPSQEPAPVVDIKIPQVAKNTAVCLSASLQQHLDGQQMYRTHAEIDNTKFYAPAAVTKEYYSGEPETLLVTLSRSDEFGLDMNHRNHTPVTFPQSGTLTLTIDAKTLNYQVTGYTIHLGRQATGGHHEYYEYSPNFPLRHYENTSLSGVLLTLIQGETTDSGENQPPQEVDLLGLG